MGCFAGPDINENGLVLALDAANKKSYSQNEFQYSTDIFGWYTNGAGTANNATITRDTISSPVGNTPLKMEVTGNDPHIGTYNNSTWNIAPAVNGQTWVVSVYAKASVATTGQIFIFGANSSGTGYVSGAWLTISAATLNITTEWTRISHYITMNNANIAYIHTRLDGPDTGGSGQTIWWDGLQVEKVPSGTTTPSTFTSVYKQNTFTSLIGNTNLSFINNQYSSYSDINSIRFTRNETFSSFTGSISGTVLTVSTTPTVTLRTGMALSYSGLTPPVTISSFGTGNGGTGTYNLSVDKGTVASTSMTAAYKDGGNCYVTASGSLASNTYLYNDHTTEVWARINDRNPAYYDGYEGESVLVTFAGYHSMFLYGSSYLRYYIWDNTGPTPKWTSDLTLGTSGTDIIQGQWFQVVVTKSGSTFNTYLNGVLRKTDTITTTAFSGTGNRLSFGGANYGNTGSFYCYSKNDIGMLKMYNITLTDSQIQQNFNATRSRYGI